MRTSQPKAREYSTAASAEKSPRVLPSLIAIRSKMAGRRRVGADANVRAQAQVRPGRLQVAGVEGNSEVRSAAQLFAAPISSMDTAFHRGGYTL
jgi:hypothetical protein